MSFLTGIIILSMMVLIAGAIAAALVWICGIDDDSTQNANTTKCFKDWWHETGSAISPNDGHEDVSEFAHRVCREAWKASKNK